MTRKGLWLVLVIVGVGIAAVGCPQDESGVARRAASAECTGDDNCDVGSVCENGACEPAACQEIYDPVCGEDGESYANACEARAAHVPVAHPGECQQVCGGVAGAPCPEGELCDLPAGECEAADPEGVCAEQPEVCAEIYDPVCGCDGVTYSNDCFRRMAGAQLDYAGECEVTAG